MAGVTEFLAKPISPRPLSAHPERRRQSAPVHQDKTYFGPGTPAQYEQYLYRARAPHRREVEILQQPSLLDKARSAVYGATQETVMAKDKSGTLEIKTFADHHVITQPIPCKRCCGASPKKTSDDPVARAEKALAGLSGRVQELDGNRGRRLSAAHAAILKDGFTKFTREELFRAAHDIKATPPLRIPFRRRRRREPLQDHRARARSRRGAVRMIAHHINAIQPSCASAPSSTR